MRYALKEWAVLCQAMAEGRQTILLRKGGIAEDAGTFRVEHERFWLYPTYVHQQQEGIKPEAAALLEEVLRNHPADGRIRIELYAEIAAVHAMKDLATIQRLDPMHLWSDAAVNMRFHYRQPGLNVLVLRVFRMPKAIEVGELPRYAGCKSWVELEEDLSTEGAKLVLEEDQFQEMLRSVSKLLQSQAN